MESFYSLVRAQEKPKTACSWPFFGYRENLQRKVGEKFRTYPMKETA